MRRAALPLFLILLTLVFAAPLFAQTGTSQCNLGITVTCNGGNCTAVTTNNGNNVCSGLFYSGFEAPGTQATITAFTSGIPQAECFDSHSIPGSSVTVPFVFCYGISSLAPGGSITGTATVSGAGASVLAFTGVVDETNPHDSNPSFVYAFANAQVPTCTPVASAPAVAQENNDYPVTWTAVSNPQTQYQVDESTTADFSAGVTTKTVAGTSTTFNHSVEQPVTYYYRVRALNCGGGPGPYSATVSTVVKSTPVATGSRGADAVVPVGSTQPVEFQVRFSGPAGKDGALDTGFTATSDKPYITVTPSSGTVQPGVTSSVTATVNPANLPPGANTGTVTVTSTSGTTLANTPLSVSLVTPVGPGSKTLPPSNALIIPVVTHVNGATSPFLSDVRLTNAAPSSISYQLTFTPTRTNGTSSSKVTAITVDPQQTIALNDIVNDFFGLGATGASNDTGFGSLEIRPLNSSSNLTFASSRTYASTPLGTFGQFIAAIPFSKFIGPGTVPPLGMPSPHASLFTLQQIAQSSAFRTNLGLTEGSGQPASGKINVFDDDNHLLASIPYSLQPGEQQQMNAFLAANGISLEDGRFEITVDSATGAVAAYASVLDNKTTDPLAVMPAQASAISATRFVVPGIADLNNGAANFHSDVRFFNGGTSAVSGTLTYFPQGNPAGATVSPRTVNIDPGKVLALDNVLPTVFGVHDTGGSVLLTTTAPASVVATARTYSIRSADGGTFGQFIPGVTPAEGIGTGDRPLEILQLEHSQNFRTNVGIAELTGNPVHVRLTMYLPDSRVSPSTEFDLAANEFRQLNGVVGALNNGKNTYNARITIEVVSGAGRVTAYGSVVDNATQDPTYVPAQ